LYRTEYRCRRDWRRRPPPGRELVRAHAGIILNPRPQEGLSLIRDRAQFPQSLRHWELRSGAPTLIEMTHEFVQAVVVIEKRQYPRQTPVQQKRCADGGRFEAITLQRRASESGAVAKV